MFLRVKVITTSEQQEQTRPVDYLLGTLGCVVIPEVGQEAGVRAPTQAQSDTLLVTSQPGPRAP